MSTLSSEKVAALRNYQNALTYRLPVPIVSCIGLAFDEQPRIKKLADSNAYSFIQKRFPLAEWEITEKQALEYCQKLGFTWGGLYQVFDRVSCFCCPLGGISKARRLWRHYPNLWQQILKMEAQLEIDPLKRRYIKKHSASDLTIRFIKESLQQKRQAS